MMNNNLPSYAQGNYYHDDNTQIDYLMIPLQDIVNMCIDTFSPNTYFDISVTYRTRGIGQTYDIHN
jgi:hypothetical protein